MPLQPLVTELLELAPARKRLSSGETIQNLHDGVEIVYVIHGSIRVQIDVGSENSYNRLLRHENCIHFNSAYTHQITNEGNTTSALLLIVRLPTVLS
jgi:quercetin dioxygenase-like cupin family protein